MTTTRKKGATVKKYDQDSDLNEVFVGKRIVKAELDVQVPNQAHLCWDERIEGTDPYGRLTLDDGTEVYVVGNDGGCACSAGCYVLTHLAKVDNVITAVRVEDKSTGDFNYDWNSTEDQSQGKYSIFVVTEAGELNIAEFEGDDGNGYYGTGFHVGVIGVG